MTIAQLREEVGFMAGIPDIDALGGWFDNEFRSIMDEYTALTKYDDLYVPDYNAPYVAASGNVFLLPANLQHLDDFNVRFSSTPDRNYHLTKGNFRGENVGNPIYYLRTWNPLVTGMVLKLYPYAEITDTDSLVINYWSTFPVGGDTATIIPHMLGPVVRSELVARANAYLGDGKKFEIAAGQSNKAFVKGMGTVDLGSQNQ